VFSDSLPDGWGRLIVDRLLAQNGINPMQMGNLDRLAIVGQSGMGALEYEPVWNIENKDIMLSYDEIAKECKKILHEEMSQQLDYLFKNGGSSGGARPKILTTVDGEEWIIKFPSSGDSKNIGKQEYDYALCAKECQIEMEEVRLFSSKLCDGYFGTRRFDRNGENKIHMVSASGLLETSHRIPNLDYDILMKLTLQLTKDMSECQKLFKIMCFNVFAHNRDDHSKNFTYQYLEKEKRWVLSPAYDLTYSNSLGGEHATMVHGEGKNPTMQNIIMDSVKVGVPVRLKNVNFASNSSALVGDAVSFIHLFYQFLTEYPNYKVEICGHTDNIGNPESNLVLSRKRCNVVKNYLIKLGIDPKRLIVKAYGQTKPIVPNSNSENRALNRRVEFVLFDK